MGRTATFVVLAAAAAAPALAQSPARSSVVANGSITVMDPVALGQGAQLGRGAVLRPGGAAVAHVPGAAYTLSGAAGETFNVIAPPAIALSRSGGPEQLQLNLVPSTVQGVVAGRDGARGVVNFQLNGSLPLPAGATGGLYVGEYGVTVAYP